MYICINHLFRSRHFTWHITPAVADASVQLEVPTEMPSSPTATPRESTQEVGETPTGHPGGLALPEVNSRRQPRKMMINSRWGCPHINFAAWWRRWAVLWSLLISGDFCPGLVDWNGTVCTTPASLNYFLVIYGHDFWWVFEDFFCGAQEGELPQLASWGWSWLESLAISSSLKIVGFQSWGGFFVTVNPEWVTILLYPIYII